MTSVRYSRTIRYVAASPNGGTPRPYLAVTLVSEGVESPRILAVVDSGADRSLFHEDIAVAMGLALSPPEIAQGQTQELAIRYADVILKVAGKQFAARAGFSRGAPMWAGFLGRADFFRAFDVGFDERGQRLLLQPLLDTT